MLFIGLGKLFDMSMGINTNIIQNSRYFKFNFYAISLLAVLGISTNLILIPILGINGAAIASLISISLVNISRAIFIKYKFDLQPFGSRSPLAALIVLICYITSMLLPELQSALWDIFYRSVCVVLVFSFLAITSKVSQDLNNSFTELIKKAKAILK